MESQIFTSHYLANVPGIEDILAIKVLMPVGGGGGSRQMHYLANVPGIEDILAIKVLLTCYCLLSKGSTEGLHLLFFFNFFFLKLFCRTHSHVQFLGPLVPLFWISGDISSGFQSQNGFCLIHISEANVMYIS